MLYHVFANFIRVRYGARDFFFLLLLVTRDVTNSRLYGVTIPKIFKKIKNFQIFSNCNREN